MHSVKSNILFFMKKICFFLQKCTFLPIFFLFSNFFQKNAEFYNAVEIRIPTDEKHSFFTIRRTRFQKQLEPGRFIRIDASSAKARNMG